MPKAESSGTLRHELEQQIRSGQCAYCRRPAAPEQPLTREHVIPRARGGRRNDVRIIVPACVRCNRRRGCQALALFLLERPRRISAFLDYLAALSPHSIQQMDLRIFAELYAAVWVLNECASHGREWRAHLRRVSGGRTLHRRRYAARRVVRDVGTRLGQRRGRPREAGGEVWMLPLLAAPALRAQMEEPLERLCSRLLDLLSRVWQVSALEVKRELAFQLDDETPPLEPESADEGVLVLDGWTRRRRTRRMRVDRRRGRAA